MGKKKKEKPAVIEKVVVKQKRTHYKAIGILVLIVVFVSYVSFYQYTELVKMQAFYERESEFMRTQDLYGQEKDARETAEDRIASLETQVSSLTGMVTAKNTEIENLQAELAEKESEISSLSSNLETVETALVTAQAEYGVGDTMSKNGFDITLWDVEPDFNTGDPSMLKVFALTFNIKRTGISTVSSTVGGCSGLPKVGLWDPSAKKMYVDIRPSGACDSSTDFWRKTVYIDRRVYALSYPVDVIVSMENDITPLTTMGMIDPASFTKYVFEIVPFDTS